jgi:hypothetical protein
MQVIERYKRLQVGPSGKFNIVDTTRVKFHEICDIIHAVFEGHPNPVLFSPMVSEILSSINWPLFGIVLFLGLAQGLPLLR